MRIMNLTKSFVDKLEPFSKVRCYWDNQIKGFGIKVTEKGRKIYIFKYRNKTRIQRKYLIGIHGNITCEQARKIAQDLAYQVSAGKDPANEKTLLRDAPNVSELADKFMAEHSYKKKKPSGAALDAHYVKNYIKPKLGQLKVIEVTNNDIISFHTKLSKHPAQANRMLATLSKMFNLAEKWGFRPLNSNPVKNVDKYPEKPRDRYLSEKEIKELLQTLRNMEDKKEESPFVIALIRLLLFSGARLREIMLAKWEWVDFERSVIKLPDSKTGKKNIILSPFALEILDRIPKIKGNPYIICGKKDNKPLNNARKPWLRIRKRAKIEDVRIHDLRHSFASICIGQGMDLYTIGKLLGHAKQSTTQRYSHLSTEFISKAAEKTGFKFEELNK